MTLAAAVLAGCFGSPQRSHPESAAASTSSASQSTAIYDAAFHQDVWQYWIDVPASGSSSHASGAWLWLPPAAKKTRGLIISNGFMDCWSDPAVRTACAEAGIGILVFHPALDGTWEDRNGDSLRRLDAALDLLGQASGQPALAKAPLMPVGHSTGTIFSTRFPFAHPGRCFAAVTFKGGFCVAEDVSTAPIRGLPWLHIQGQFEEFGPGPSGALRADEDRTTGARTAQRTQRAFRARDDALLLGLAVDPGATHMTWSPRTYPLLAAFIAGATRLRIGEDGRCRAVAPESGATLPGDVLGLRDPTEAAADFWFPDATCRQRAAELHAQLPKKPQFVAFLDGSGRALDGAHDLRLRMSPTVVDADILQIRTDFVTTGAQRKYPPADPPIGHAEGPILVRAARSSVLQSLGDGRFRIGWDGRGGYGMLVAEHPGDEVYRPAMQAGYVRLAMPAGAATQAVIFEPPRRIRVADLPLPLSATASSGLTPIVAVIHGPARLDDRGRLVLDQVGVTSPWPLQVQVGACQPGRWQAPYVAPSQPVLRTIAIDRDGT